MDIGLILKKVQMAPGLLTCDVIDSTFSTTTFTRKFTTIL
jgi:hypothetical protein